MPESKKKKRSQTSRNHSVVSLKQPTPTYIYSVDDDLDEIEQDMEREYLEGYNDALRYRYKRSNKNLKDGSPAPPSTITSTGVAENNLQHRILSNLRNADTDLKRLEQAESDQHRHHAGTPHHLMYQQLESSSCLKLPKLSSVPSPNDVDTQDVIIPKNNGNTGTSNTPNTLEEEQGGYQDDDEADEYDQGDDDDNLSVSTMESFTLRERQNAINKTHPFGIRIWKPALYKKIRSVDREADQDIHEIIESEDSHEGQDQEAGLDHASFTKKNKKKTINWSVHLSNLIWAFTFGLVLFLISIFGSVILMMFEFMTGHIEYSKVLFNLSIYLIWPFGKVVYLQKDENYLVEDENEGTTIHEYQRWRDEEQTKLFFSPSNSQVNTDNATAQNEAAGSSSLSPTIQPQKSSTLAADPQVPKHTEVDPLHKDHNQDDFDKKLRFFGRGDWSLGRIVFFVYFYIVLQPVLAVIWLICWLLLFTIPMSKVIIVLTNHLRRHPLAIFFKFDSYLLPHQSNLQHRLKKNSNILVCTYRSMGLHYWKYTVDGTNVILINLLFVVLFTIFDFFFLREFLHWDSLFITSEPLIFALCLLSIIPLAYFIGQAVASISAQSSMGVGAVINAFFSTIVEIFLYCVALDQNKGLLVEGSMIGSILGGVLLLPGLSMCAGAFIRKTQRYNPASAGVSSTMLLFSVSVMFAPTVFHQIYGAYEIKCVPCSPAITSMDKSSPSSPITTPTCQNCHFFQPPLALDDLFNTVLKPFSVVCALLLFLAYTIGLWFTLRTHAALIWQTPITEPVKQPKSLENSSSLGGGGGASGAAAQTNQMAAADYQEPEPQGHDSPNWSRQKSTIVLLTATLFYAVIAEILVDCVDSVLKQFPINPKFLGITIFALVPNTTEFLNAISFATHGNVALSMEIGSAYALQVCLIQIPSLVLYSLFVNKLEVGQPVRDNMFTLIFPNWDLVASVVSIGLFTYVYAEGKSNYFKGSILILIYLVVLCGFWYTGEIDSQGGFYRSFIIRS